MIHAHFLLFSCSFPVFSPETSLPNAFPTSNVTDSTSTSQRFIIISPGPEQQQIFTSHLVWWQACKHWVKPELHNKEHWQSWKGNNHPQSWQSKPLQGCSLQSILQPLIPVLLSEGALSPAHPQGKPSAGLPLGTQHFWHAKQNMENTPTTTSVMIYEALFKRSGKHTCKEAKSKAKWNFGWKPLLWRYHKGRQNQTEVK